MRDEFYLGVSGVEACRDCHSCRGLATGGAVCRGQGGGYPPDAGDVRRELRTYIDGVEAACGCKSIIYAGNDIYDRYLRGYYDDCDLWISCRKWPAWIEWSQGGWTIWQYSDVGLVPGTANVDGHVDLDVLAEGLTVDDLLM